MMITGQAEQILWNFDEKITEEGIIDELKLRYGSEQSTLLQTAVKNFASRTQ